MMIAGYEIMTDLTKLDIVSMANEGTKMPIRHPMTDDILSDDKGTLKTPEPKEWFLRLLGADSDTYRNTIKRRFESRRGKSKKVDLDQAQRDAAILLARCTTECHMTENGVPVKCDVDTLTVIYTKYPWLREQAEEFMSDRANLITD
jgi:hypothetical protein